MLLPGIITEHKKATIEVDLDSLILQIELMVKEKRSKLAASDIFFDKKDSTWYKYSYTHPHNNDDVYEEYKGELTEDDKYWITWLREFKKLLKEKK